MSRDTGRCYIQGQEQTGIKKDRPGMTPTGAPLSQEAALEEFRQGRQDAGLAAGPSLEDLDKRTRQALRSCTVGSTHAEQRDLEF